jgi:hypothetical protein
MQEQTQEQMLEQAKLRIQELEQAQEQMLELAEKLVEVLVTKLEAVQEMSRELVLDLEAPEKEMALTETEMVFLVQQDTNQRVLLA